MAKNGKPSMAVRIVAVVAALAVGLLGGLMIVGLLAGDGDGGDQASQGAQEAQQEAAAGAQSFDTDAATVEYRGTQDAAGNAVITFAVTNKTGGAVSVYFENVVVNDQFNIEAMGGTEVPIEPGNTGAASLAFGVSVQTTLDGVADLKTLSADLVLYSDSPTEPVATVPVSVSL